MVRWPGDGDGVQKTLLAETALNLMVGEATLEERILGFLVGVIVHAYCTVFLLQNLKENCK